MLSNRAARDIIVADNDYMIRDILRSVLENRGYSVLLAIDGVEALDYAARTLACLVILDLRMPRLDGFAACAGIRRLRDYAAVPIAILSAFATEPSRAAAQRAGATTFLAKPFTPMDLLRMVTALLGDTPPVPNGAAVRVWGRRLEPAPLFGEPVELSNGRRVLNICRR
jgi:two-component system, chemotaxis family, chemotaxis protein CheY